MNAFVSQFKANINFSYTCFDRIILRGYIRKVFFAGAVVYFLRALGFEKLSQAVLRILTDQLTKHIKREAEKYHIPVIWWNSIKGTEKEKLKYVQRHYARKFKGKGNFVFCIIIAKENVLTFGSKELESKQGEKYHKLYKCKKLVNHFYIYFHDEVLGGPCYLKICSYLPFQCEFYFNGHNAIKLELTKRGIKYQMEDNAITWIEDPQALEEIAQSLKGETVLKRIQYWMDRFFKFDKGDRTVRPEGLEHEWYVYQVEVCSNIIFKSARFCTRLFERLLDKFTRFGLPDRISQIFDKRPRRSNSKSTWKIYDNKACVRFWFRKNSVKMYNKNGSFIRVDYHKQPQLAGA